MSDLDIALEQSFVSVVFLLMGLWGLGVAATLGMWDIPALWMCGDVSGSNVRELALFNDGVIHFHATGVELQKASDSASQSIAVQHGVVGKFRQ